MENLFPLSTILGTPSDSFMDLDYMDGLLLEGCWLETNGSEFSNFDISTPISPFEPSFPWPSLESNNAEFAPKKESFLENLSIGQLPHQNIENVQDLDLSKRYWIGPNASTPVMDRLIRALNLLKDFSKDKDVLVQVWVPVNRGGKRVLATNDKLVSFDLNSPSLANYREVSEKYQFPAEEDSKESVGLPGRVFRSKSPEWTPDVRFFTREEYPRVENARMCNVRGTLAVPILERGSQNCVGVIEFVSTSQKIKYRPELDSVCKALEAVDLQSSEISKAKNVKTRDLSYQSALPEILDVLKSACDAYGLPLAQTWVPCVLQGKEGCHHSDEDLGNYISTVDSACYIGDPRIQGFQESCSEYHLLKGQGIVGKAFNTNQPCFSADVTSFSKTEYPLSHHARMFGLRSAVAIRLRSMCTGTVDFVLEFFLPLNCRNLDEQKKMLSLVSNVIQNVCTTLRVVKEEEVEKVANFWEIDGSHFSRSSPENNGSVFSVLDKGKSGEIFGESSKFNYDSNSREGVTFVTNPSTSGDGSSTKKGEKRRVKAEKTITLQLLRQHFAGSLKDAAKNLGVCPTTLKRICRQHGIQRWPSRKLKKVGHSLQKIQRVIDSVQGASGALKIESFYSNFPNLASPNASQKTHFSNFETTNHINPLHGNLENDTLSPPNAQSVSTPSSSYSQNSSSSQCYSSGTLTFGGQENSNVKEEKEYNNNNNNNNDRVIKRAKSDAHIHLLDNGPTLLQRSASLMMAPLQTTSEKTGPRIKVSFGEEKLRFRMQNKWGYKDLVREISRRFGVLGEVSGYHLKYLDDDAEWVLLTCDADLEECIDVCRESQSQTIKLSFSRDCQTRLSGSLGSRGLL